MLGAHSRYIPHNLGRFFLRRLSLRVNIYKRSSNRALRDPSPSFRVELFVVAQEENPALLYTAGLTFTRERRGTMKDAILSHGLFRENLFLMYYEWPNARTLFQSKKYQKLEYILKHSRRKISLNLDYRLYRETCSI